MTKIFVTNEKIRNVNLSDNVFKIKDVNLVKISKYFFILNHNHNNSFRLTLDCFVLWLIPTKDYRFIPRKSLSRIKEKNDTKSPRTFTLSLIMLIDQCWEVRTECCFFNSSHSKWHLRNFNFFRFLDPHDLMLVFFHFCCFTDRENQSILCT